ncbi:MAG: hypothetical protein Q4C75_00745 [Bergeyella zoohelcum]|nr:hypothetical protein [Bergeyella zoohelcum]
MKAFYSVFLLLFASVFTFAQDIYLSSGGKVNANVDKRLYRMEKVDSTLQSLGEIEIKGVLIDPEKAFKRFYEKAKLVGANAYVLQTSTDLYGKPVITDEKKIKLYYLEQLVEENQNEIYVFNLSKTQELEVNDETKTLPIGTYLKLKIDEGRRENYISTKKILGARINFEYKPQQPAQYFAYLKSGLKPDENGDGGLVFKTGDFILLETSFAKFLQMFYKEI